MRLIFHPRNFGPSLNHAILIWSLMAKVGHVCRRTKKKAVGICTGGDSHFEQAVMGALE